jgi:hypothetical protein
MDVVESALDNMEPARQKRSNWSTRRLGLSISVAIEPGGLVTAFGVASARLGSSADYAEWRGLRSGGVTHLQTFPFHADLAVEQFRESTTSGCPLRRPAARHCRAG